MRDGAKKAVSNQGYRRTDTNSQTQLMTLAAEPYEGIEGDTRTIPSSLSINA
jgi:hypothetical protein